MGTFYLKLGLILNFAIPQKNHFSLVIVPKAHLYTELLASLKTFATFVITCICRLGSILHTLS